MNESLFDKLVEISWRRRLTPEEEAQLQAWLATHPDDAERWEWETSLNGALDRLEEVAPSSNFTSQVLQLVERESRAEARQESTRAARWWSLSRFRIAWATAFAVVIVALSIYQFQDHQSKKQITRGVQSTVAAFASADVLEDFETIREFSQVRQEVDPTDEALFVLLSKSP